MPLPTFLIIGSAKAGTTSLHYYLDHHPQIDMSRPKEVNFFSDPVLFARGLDWYARHFKGPGPQFGEASPKYSVHPIIAGVPERIAKALPQARLIYCVRDPVERVVARYLHALNLGTEVRSLHQCLADEGSRDRYLAGARYAHQLEQYLAYFSLDKILILHDLELRDQRSTCLDRVHQFLGVSPFQGGDWQSKQLNLTRQKRQPSALGRKLLGLIRRLPLNDRLRHRLSETLLVPWSRPLPPEPLQAEDRLRLQDFLRADAQRFGQLTGLSFPDWTWV